MEILISFIIPFIILLTVVVFIHEYGHYYYAKKYGVGVTDFSIGFGKEIFGFNDKSGTRWKFCLIPLGGYVKFFGDRNVFSQAEQEELLKKYSKEDQKKLFVTKPLYQRSLIVAGGPLANFLLAILIFTFINIFVGKDFTQPKIEEITINSPAEKAGLKKNDIIIGINDNKVESILEVSTYINTNNSDKLKIQVLRGQKKISLVAIPEIIDSKDPLGNSVKKKIIGIKIGPANNEFNKEKLNLSADSITGKVGDTFFWFPDCWHGRNANTSQNGTSILMCHLGNSNHPSKDATGRTVNYSKQVFKTENNKKIENKILGKIFKICGRSSNNFFTHFLYCLLYFKFNRIAQLAIEQKTIFTRKKYGDINIDNFSIFNYLKSASFMKVIIISTKQFIKKIIGKK
mgnify:CR=1 FL=1